METFLARVKKLETTSDYVRFENVLQSQVDQESLLKLVNPLTPKYITEIRGIDHDQKRQRSHFPFGKEGRIARFMESIIGNFKDDLSGAFRNFTFSRESIIRSPRNGYEQELHQDYDEDSLKSRMQYSVLIPLIGDGKLNVLVEGKVHCVTFKYGSALVFRGTLFHGGAAYEEKTYRYFAKFHHKEFTLPKVETLYYNTEPGVSLSIQVSNPCALTLTLNITKGSFLLINCCRK